VFDDVVTISGSDLELELKSDSTASLLQNADYESGSGSTTLKFIYTVKDGDNGADIDVEQIKLNSSTIIDNYANNADLSIPPNTTLSTQKIGVDTLRPISLGLSPVVPGAVSGINIVELSISGSNLVAYKYKAAISEADCKSQASYQTTADLNPVSVDVSSFVDGEVHICATGISTSGYEQDSSLAASISYTRDTTCGHVAGDGSSSDPYEIRNEDDLSNMDKADICASSSFTLMNDIIISSANWSSIGKNTSSGEFKGRFEGNDFTISGLSIDKNEDQIGLFSVLKNATIENLNLIAEEIKGNEAVGGLAGSAENSSIYNCSVEGDVHSDAKQLYIELFSAEPAKPPTASFPFISSAIKFRFSIVAFFSTEKRPI
jgi:hypothetical protein